MIRQYKDLILQAYEAFNARDLDKVLMLMHPDVRWPNDWKGGQLQGPEEVRSYWTAQFKELDPAVEPVSIQQRPDGSIEVQVHAIVKDLDGNLLDDNHLLHVYRMEDGLIQKMIVEEAL